MAQAISTNTFTAATWIVNTDATKGTHTTLVGALSSASSGDNILLQSSVTENPIFKAGVNIFAPIGSALTPTISITGKCAFSSAGTTSLSGIRLNTNSDFCLAVTGSAASIVNLDNCYLNCTNNTGISFTSSSASSQININNSSGDLGTTGIGLFSASGSGTLNFQKSGFTNSGSSTTASTISSGTLGVGNSTFSFPITTSSTASIIGSQSSFNTIATNTISLTHGGTTQSLTQSCIFSSGSASAVSIGAGATLYMPDCNVSSTNTNAITGSGTLYHGELIFTGSSSTINTSTVNLLPVGKIYSPTGITFDNSNTLSTFSQGTFSPTIRGSATAGTIAYGTQEGRYQKVGRVVTMSIIVSWTTIGTATGAVQCNNLPFTIINSGGAGLVPSLVASWAGTLVTASGAVPFIQGNNNTTTANINYYLGLTGVGNASVITASNQFSTQYVYETT